MHYFMDLFFYDIDNFHDFFIYPLYYSVSLQLMKMLIGILMARIRMLFRRSGEQTLALLTVNDLTLDTKAREVRLQGNIIELTPKEFSILEFLWSRDP